MWPYFAKVKETNELVLPIGLSTLEAIGGYLYGQTTVLSFDEAARLVKYAQMYDLPELLEMAVQRVQRGVVRNSQAIYLWQLSLEAENEELRMYAALQVHKLMPSMNLFKERFDGMDKENMVRLFQDVCVVMAEKK